MSANFSQFSSSSAQCWNGSSASCPSAPSGSSAQIMSDFLCFGAFFCLFKNDTNSSFSVTSDDSILGISFLMRSRNVFFSELSRLEITKIGVPELINNLSIKSYIRHCATLVFPMRFSMQESPRFLSQFWGELSSLE